jgi:anti-anti-sigma factor
MNAKSAPKIEEKSGRVWVTLPDAIDMDSYASIENEITRAIAADRAQVVLDLSSTSQLFSSGLGLIIRVRKVVLERNGAVYLVNVSGKIKGIIEAVNLDGLFPLYATDVEFEISQEQFRTQAGGRKVGFVFISRIENGIFRIHCSGQLTVEQDLSSIHAFARDGSIGHYIFDLTGLDMIDSTGAAIFIKITKDIHEHGGRNLAYGATPSVAELITLLGLDEYITLLPDERSALLGARRPAAKCP